MKKILPFALLTLGLLTSCYNVERNCKDFKTGEFQFEYEVNGVKKTSHFVRNDTLEIDTFEGKTDTSKVRWINDCEYILEKMNPKNMAEKQAIHMKILSTTENSYTFEFSKLGNTNKQKGTVTKIK
ncbi:DNA topoisomerase IV [Flavobacterium lindanitolerans]|uniref:DNA topoisomerase IV n=1 Tax=Flavobacterium lindanitolerans TaxID=428988 RepID=UPI002809DFE9|nr:DNA topoisomerase IV [Flavobacterium lindanitolerans]MDQ7960862.1 DNA topoisomerase IV [Flavobacterium lindanitolerans]